MLVLPPNGSLVLIRTGYWRSFFRTSTCKVESDRDAAIAYEDCHIVCRAPSQGKFVSTAIVAAGLGNVKSVKRMIDHIGGSCELIDQPKRLADFDNIILPGVGAFDHGMMLLEQQGWIEELDAAVHVRGQNILGICLGMQLLCRGSEEGQRQGLGYIPASVKRLKASDNSRIKIPHIGWSVTTPTREAELFRSGQPELRYYFVHGYSAHCDADSNVLASVQYGGPIVAAITNNANVQGVQFHPEKSHRFGMDLFRNFLKLA
jgi:imidazole glycerol-phosphate synthase subunit HisH